MDRIFINQRDDELSRHGYIESAADADFFKSLLEEMRDRFSNVKFVTKTGEYSVRQIIYIPKGKRAVLAKLRSELKQYEASVNNTVKAIADIEKKEG